MLVHNFVTLVKGMYVQYKHHLNTDVRFHTHNIHYTTCIFTLPSNMIGVLEFVTCNDPSNIFTYNHRLRAGNLH